jgi:hypothetical protein
MGNGTNPLWLIDSASGFYLFLLSIGRLHFQPENHTIIWVKKHCSGVDLGGIRRRKNPVCQTGFFVK